MLPTIHCAAPDCQSTCQLSSKDRDRVPAALKERGWATIGDKAHWKHYCPAHWLPAPADGEPVYVEQSVPDAPGA